MAAKPGKPFVTIESDKYFLRALEKKISKDGFYDGELQTYRYRNIGLTEAGGFPFVFFKPTKKRLASFSKYSDFPLTLSSNNHAPILILIDGRFRVACALKAIQSLKEHKNWTLVVDDYLSTESWIDRSHYKLIERFARLDRFVGRMAVFTASLQADESTPNQTIKCYEHDAR